MCATWPGASAGFISITTGPLVVSRVSVSPGFAISAFSSSLRCGRHAHGHDLVGIRDRAVVFLRAGLDLVDRVHPRHDLAEGGIFAVEEVRVAGRDEKLRI